MARTVNGDGIARRNPATERSIDAAACPEPLSAGSEMEDHMGQGCLDHLPGMVRLLNRPTRGWRSSRTRTARRCATPTRPAGGCGRCRTATDRGTCGCGPRSAAAQSTSMWIGHAAPRRPGSCSTGRCARRCWSATATAATRGWRVCSGTASPSRSVHPVHPVHRCSKEPFATFVAVVGGNRFRFPHRLSSCVFVVLRG